MHDDVKNVIASETEIKAIVEKMGKILTQEYQGQNPLILCVLKGGAPFAMDLIRAMNCPVQLDFLQVSSYGDGVTSNGFVFKKDIEADMRDRHVIIVDDILDTGNTLLKLKKHLLERGPKSLKLCVMFDKPSCRRADIQADYAGMQVPNEFLVGYGLDYAEAYRNLPYVGVLKPEIYEGKS